MRDTKNKPIVYPSNHVESQQSFKLSIFSYKWWANLLYLFIKNEFFSFTLRFYSITLFIEGCRKN